MPGLKSRCLQRGHRGADRAADENAKAGSGQKEIIGDSHQTARYQLACRAATRAVGTRSARASHGDRL